MRAPLVGLGRGALLLLVALVATGCARSEAPRSVGQDVRANLRTIAGLPQDGITLGRVDAPATLTYYTSLDAFTIGFFTRDLPVIVQRWVRPGRLRVQIRLITAGTPDHGAPEMAGAAARLATSVGVDDHLWDFVASLSARYPGYLDDRLTKAALGDVPGVDPAVAAERARSPRVAKAAARNSGRAATVGIHAFPAFVFDGARADNERLNSACSGCLVGALARALAAEAKPAPPTAVPHRRPAAKKRPAKKHPAKKHAAKKRPAKKHAAKKHHATSAPAPAPSRAPAVAPAPYRPAPVAPRRPAPVPTRTPAPAPTATPQPTASPKPEPTMPPKIPAHP